jgi:uncharacterized protein YhjY with autotransporter beta-barrel domain
LGEFEIAGFVRRALRGCGAAGVLAAGSVLCQGQAAQAQTMTISAPPTIDVLNPPSGLVVVPVSVSISSGAFGSTLTWTPSVSSSTGGTAVYDAGNSTCPSTVNTEVPLSCTVAYDYTPKPGYFGSDSFGVTVGGTSFSSQSATIMMTDFPAQLGARSFTATTAAATASTVDLAAGGDITCDNSNCGGGLPLTVTLVSGPAHGTATVSGTSVTYVPAAGFAGTDALVYQVSDADDQTASATMTVTVVQPTATVPGDLVGKAQAAGSAELTAAGFTVTVGTVYSTSVPAGDIASSQPAPGSTAARGSTVKVLVSRGPGAVASGPLSSQPGLTPEQASTARGVEQACGALAQASVTGTALTPAQQDLLDKCTALISDYSGGANGSGLQQAMNAISGRQMMAGARMPMQFAAGQIANIDGRLQAVQAGERGVSLTGLDLGLPGPAQALLGPLLQLARGALGGSAGADSPGGLLDNRLGVFVTGTLRQGSQTTTDAEEGFGYRDDGLTAGADYRLGTSYVLGIAGGLGRSHADFDDGAGRMDAHHWSASLYGSYFTDRYHLDWLAGFEHSSLALDRQITYQSNSSSVGCGGGECSTTAGGSTGSREYLLSATAGGDFNWRALAFGPTLGVDYKQVRLAGFTEGGPSGLDLAYGGMTTDSLLAKLGGYVSYAVKTRWAVLLPQVQAHYLHEFRNDARTQSVGFAADTLPGASTRTFQIYSDALNRNYFDWRVSLEAQFPFGIAGFIDYGAISGLQLISEHEFDIGLRVELGSR